MTKIGAIIQDGIYNLKQGRKRLFVSNCNAEQYKEMFIESASSRMYGSGFVVDEHNKDLINQLYYYLIASEQFKGDLVKGILLLGAIGNGKTVIMESFIDVFNSTSNKIITTVHAKDLSRIIIDNTVGYLNKRPLFIDDIGKEQESIKNYGTTVHPFEDTINERYKNFGLTFGTANYTLDDLPYDRHTIDRMKQMFNVIILPGKSRRV